MLLSLGHDMHKARRILGIMQRRSSHFMGSRPSIKRRR